MLLTTRIPRQQRSLCPLKAVNVRSQRHCGLVEVANHQLPAAHIYELDPCQLFEDLRCGITLGAMLILNQVHSFLSAIQVLMDCLCHQVMISQVCSTYRRRLWPNSLWIRLFPFWQDLNLIG